MNDGNEAPSPEINSAQEPPPSLSPNREITESFLKLLSGDTMLLAKRPDSGGPWAMKGLDKIAEAFTCNARGITNYFGINIVKQGVNKKATKDDIETIRIVYADIDWDLEKYNGRFSEGMQEVKRTVLTPLLKMTPQPTLIIFTGGGLQPLWFIEPLPNTPENMARAEAVGAYIANRFGGDAVANIDRILRLPGTLNHPKKDKRDAGQPTKLAEYRVISGKTHTLEELEAAWGVDAAAVMATRGSRPVRQGLPAGVTGPSATPLPVSDRFQDVPIDNDDLSGGVAEMVLGEVRYLGLAIASVTNGPFSVREKWVDPRTSERTDYGWIDWLYVMSGLADDYPQMEDDCLKVFDEVNEAAGGNTADNDDQWKVTAGRKTQRVAAGKEVRTVASLVKLWEEIEGLIPAPAAASDSAPEEALEEEQEPSAAHGAAAFQQKKTGGPQATVVTSDWLTTRKDFPSILPYREWALGVLASYGEVTTIASPGGFGKTAFCCGLALEAASGDDFLGHHVFIGPQKVIHISSEESEVELVHEAASRHQAIPLQVIDHILWRGTDAKVGVRIELMKMEGKNAALNLAGLAMLDRLIEISGAKVVILDPLNSFVAGGLNDNSAMGALVLHLKRIAVMRNVAIIVIHHTSKGADLESPEAVMGASAIVNHSRTVATLVRASTQEEFQFLSVLPSQGRQYFRTIYGKMNHALPPDEEQWYRLGARPDSVWTG
jgi:hypothetical protein